MRKAEEIARRIVDERHNAGFGKIVEATIRAVQADARASGIREAAEIAGWQADICDAVIGNPRSMARVETARIIKRAILDLIEKEPTDA